MEQKRIMQKITWDGIGQICANKNVVIYGLGSGIREFLDTVSREIIITAVIDNDIRKQGRSLGDLLPEAFGTDRENIVVQGTDILSSYITEETVILVASSKRSPEIVQDLKNRRFDSIFVLSDISKPLRSDTGIEQKKRQEYMAYCLNRSIEPGKILFLSYANYADHEKYIAEAVMSLKADLDIVWLVNDLDVPMPCGMRKVLRSNWKKVLYEAETAAMWIADVPVPENWIKRQGQIYIQTKHWASITLKKFYLDAVTFQSEPEKQILWKRESEMIDHIVVGSEFDKESCKRGFQFDKTFIMAGSPRSDGLFHSMENREKVYKYYGLDRETHILLYAPTYRFNREKGKSVHQSREIGFDYEAVKHVLQQRFGGQWKIALRLHPSVVSAVDSMRLPDFVFDVSAYEDSQELISAFDITVSDFSSLMFEPAFVKKPVFLYALDLEDYLENEYELLLDYRELPFDIAENTEELCSHITNFDKDQYEQRINTFFDKYDVHEDGGASMRTAEFILGLLEKQTADYLLPSINKSVDG